MRYSTRSKACSLDSFMGDVCYAVQSLKVATTYYLMSECIAFTGLLVSCGKTMSKKCIKRAKKIIVPIENYLKSAHLNSWVQSGSPMVGSC